MKIDKSKPLPDHTKLDYDECCVLLILKEVFPDRYSELEIKDRPDLQGNEIGVEVTIADERNHQEALNNWVKACASEDEKSKQKYVERMQQLGVKYTGGWQSWPGYNPTFQLVRKAVISKIEKCKKGNYKVFNQNELFIITDVWMKPAVEEAKAFFEEVDVFVCFQRVYILEKGFMLYIFERSSLSYIEINKSEQTNRNIRAREMVELAEEQENV